MSSKKGKKSKREMGRIRSSKNWFQRVGRKFLRTSQKDIDVVHSNACMSPGETQTSEAAEDTAFHGLKREVPRRTLTVEDVAAMKIQATFRGHLARRAFRALRSLVKLQALARGAYVRRQSRLALHCMHALVRLQVRIRARQLLGKCSDDY